MDRDELLTVMNKWSLEELDTYIEQLEIRITYSRGLIRDLRAIRKKKVRKNPTPDNGVRGGN